MHRIRLSLFALPLCVGAALAGCHKDRPPVVSLVADGNHSGAIEVEDVTEDTSTGRFAVLLANLDDDDLDGVADATDEALNGADDLDDLSPLELAPWPHAPDKAKIRIDVDAAVASTVRLYVLGTGADPAQPASWSLVTPPYEVLAPALRAGTRFAVEGLTLVTSTKPDAFDGRIPIHATLDEKVASSMGLKTAPSSTVTFRIAPVIFQYNTMPTQRVFYSDAGHDTESLAAGVKPIADLAQVPVEGINLASFGGDDVWMQDFIDFAIMARPAPNGGQKQIRVAIKSAQPDRDAGLIASRKFLGPDYAAFEIDDPKGSASDASYSMNSFGNWDVIPPHSAGGKTYPLGRNIWGATGDPDTSPDPIYADFVRSQAVQPEINIDTSWLLVGHVDEFTSYVPASNAHGFVLLRADCAAARAMLQQKMEAGDGATELFVGLTDYDFNTNAEKPANRTITAVLGDADLMAESQLAQSHVDEGIAKLKAALDLGDDEIISMPGLFENAYGFALAYLPGTVNLLVIDKGVVMPDPFGPQFGGQDLFKADLASRLGPLALTLGYADDWYTYHLAEGEVHCGTNVERKLSTKWWEAAQ